MELNTKYEKLKNKQVILYGAGKFGEKTLDLIQNFNTEIICFIDKDVKKWGKEYKGVTVTSPDTIKSLVYDYIMITSMYIKSVYEELISKGVDSDKIVFIPIDSDKSIEYKNMSETKSKKMNAKMIETFFQKNKVKLKENEKIRICFLFEAPTLWPSWDSLWRACLDDKKMETQIILYNNKVFQNSQNQGATEFLIKNRIPYIDYNEKIIKEFNPHIIFLQSPYEEAFRPENLRSTYLKSNGHRIIYIPYGIEISNTDESRINQFGNNLVFNAWKIYTFSSIMKENYHEFIDEKLNNIRSLGHPKFDRLYNYNLDNIQRIKEKANERKIIFFRLHFPKEVYDQGELKMVTPYLKEYYKFADHLNKYKDFYFLFRTHPKFYDTCYKFQDGLLGVKFFYKLKDNENVLFLKDEDYRLGIFSADCIIGDRSALMVESSVSEKPILYLYNKDFKEPMTKGVKRLFDSYYQGTGYLDILNFLTMCRADKDPKKDERINAFKSTIENYDGLSGYRIKEDIIQAITSE
ncbi:MAG: hypothetical protein WC983_05925 [Tissierellaceae bacterium]